jgi:hypothetical protein
MVEIPDNLRKLYDVGIDPQALVLLENRFPAELVLMASIAISLRRIALAVEDDDAPKKPKG